MAKRPTMEVDEEYLKEVMAGGAVLPKREEPDNETQTVETLEAKETLKPVRKKKEAQDYETGFFTAESRPSPQADLYQLATV